MNGPDSTRSFPQADLSGVLDGSLPPGVYRWQPDAGDPGPAIGPEEAGWHSTPVDLHGVRDGNGFLSRCATGFGFPDPAGRGWDALADSLTDLGWTDAPQRGRLVLVRGWDVFAQAAPEDAAAAADVLTTATAFWARRAAPMTVLLS
ncbi:barstar family protein [Streptomyces sp. TRM 70351]|uniref:barstar family protein n=1 Tax=Streptomyces sp. TRM 70351 TaxID=3116552 RepID=UPI002E7B2171|nr:barstar family protein [Streptomyces sp. TRM 70351]MEE1930656.1 barstar family protein [Streptomyces sp. TRM 70351]